MDTDLFLTEGNEGRKFEGGKFCGGAAWFGACDSLAAIMPHTVLFM